MEEAIKEVINKVSEDLKKLAKDYGAVVVVFLVLIYVWRKLNEK
jgi:diacylglycerol kinase